MQLDLLRTGANVYDSQRCVQAMSRQSFGRDFNQYIRFFSMKPLQLSVLILSVVPYLPVPMAVRSEA